MTEKEAWEEVLRRVKDAVHGRGRYAAFVCINVGGLVREGRITSTTALKMLGKVELARKAKHIVKCFGDDMPSLWPIGSPLRITWVKKQIKRLEKENV